MSNLICANYFSLILWLSWKIKKKEICMELIIIKGFNLNQISLNWWNNG